MPGTTLDSRPISTPVTRNEVRMKLGMLHRMFETVNSPTMPRP
jgi:hypothetical protein